MIPFLGPLLVGKLGKLFGNIAQIVLVLVVFWGLLALHDAKVRGERDAYWEAAIAKETEDLREQLRQAERAALAAKVVRDQTDKAKKEELENAIDEAVSRGDDPLNAVFDGMRNTASD